MVDNCWVKTAIEGVAFYVFIKEKLDDLTLSTLMSKNVFPRVFFGLIDNFIYWIIAVYFVNIFISEPFPIVIWFL